MVGFILEPGDYNKKKIENTIKYTIKQIGQPFDYEFANDDKKFYCSELIHDAFKSAEVTDGLAKNAKKILHPGMFINKNFEVIFVSHNLEIKKHKASLIGNV